MPAVAERAPSGWKQRNGAEINADTSEHFELPENTDSPDKRAYKRVRARLLLKVYEIDPFVCPKCGSEMKVITVIRESEEMDHILRHLVKQGRPPPRFDPASLN